MQIDAFASGVGSYQVVGPTFRRWSAEKLDLSLSFLVGQAAVDQGDLTCVAETFETAYQELRRVAVLGEDDEFFVGVLRIAEHFAQFLEFGFLSSVVQVLGFVEQFFDLDALCLQFAEIDRDGTAQDIALEPLLLLSILIGGVRFI